MEDTNGSKPQSQSEEGFPPSGDSPETHNVEQQPAATLENEQPAPPQGEPVSSQSQPMPPQGQPVPLQGQSAPPQGQLIQPQGHYTQSMQQNMPPQQQAPVQRPFYQKWWFWLIVAFVLIFVVAGITGRTSNSTQSSSSSAESSSSSASSSADEGVDTTELEAAISNANKRVESGLESYTEDSAAALTSALSDAEELLTSDELKQGDVDNAKQALAKALDSLEEKPRGFAGGMYKVGTDIPAGEYVIVGSGYLEVSSDSSGSFSSIVANDNYKNRTIISVLDGQYLTFSGRAYTWDEAPPVDTSSGKLLDGMYLVGRDFPAGEYKVVPSGFGYLEVSSDSTGSFTSIVSNDNFDTERYITVQDGQYLKLNRCSLVLQ